jgi:hypothetical protein
MINRFLLFLPVLLVLVAGCKKDEEPPAGIPMNYQRDFNIQAGLGPFVVHHFYLHDFASRYQETLAQANKSEADIKTIVLNQASLSGIFNDADFDFMYIVAVRLYDDQNPNDYIEIAYRDPVPLDPGNTLPLIPNEVDVKRFLEKTRFGIDLSVQVDKTTIDETDVRLNMEFIATY